MKIGSSPRTLRLVLSSAAAASAVAATAAFAVAPPRSSDTAAFVPKVEVESISTFLLASACAGAALILSGTPRYRRASAVLFVAAVVVTWVVLAVLIIHSQTTILSSVSTIDARRIVVVEQHVILAVVLAIVAPLLCSPREGELYPFRLWSGRWLGVGLGAIACCAIAATMFALGQYIGTLEPQHEVVGWWVMAAEPPVQLVIGAFIAPLVEEVLFRGYLHRHLRSTLPAIAAALVSACLFALVHARLGVEPLVAGFLFALLYEWRRTIVPAVMAHGLWNAARWSFEAGAHVGAEGCWPS